MASSPKWQNIVVRKSASQQLVTSRLTGTRNQAGSRFQTSRESATSKTEWVPNLKWRLETSGKIFCRRINMFLIPKSYTDRTKHRLSSVSCCFFFHTTIFILVLHESM
jgi:hypothetical protein